MKKSRFTDSALMAILKQAEVGSTVPDLCREHGMDSATFTNGEPGFAAWIYR